MAKELKVKIREAYDTEANWKESNPVLLSGQLAFSSDKKGRYKIGDGIKTWTELEYNTLAWSDIAGKPSTFNPGTHNHDDKYYTEAEIDSKLNGKVSTSRTINGKPLTSNISLTATDVGADSKGSSNTALASAKAYTDSKIDAIVGEGASETLDTIGEIAQAIEENQDMLDTLNDAIGKKANTSDLTSHTSDTTKHITSAERTNWNAAKSHADKAHAPSNAQANQNAFSNVAVGSTTIASDTPTDTLTLAGSNVTLTPDATNDKITIGITKANVTNALGYTPPTTDTKYTHPTSSGNKHIPSGGSAGQFLKWSADGTAVWSADNNTTYGLASSTTNGLIKIGYPESGKNYPVELNSSGQAFVNVPWTDNNTTYGVVSTTANGLAPKRDGSTNKYLRADGTWATPPDTNTTYTPGKMLQLSSNQFRISDYCTSITDWNSATTNGWYMGSNAANAPTSGSTWYFGHVIAHNASYVFQEVYQFTASTTATSIPKYIRVKVDGTWGAWVNVTVAKSVPSNAVFTDTKYNVATTSANGLLSSTDKAKLDGIASGANKYVLPTASSSTLGGVKTTSTVTSSSGYTACPIIGGVPYYKDTNTTYNLSSFGITATSAELNYCDGVTSNIQTQLNGKAASSHTHNYAASSHTHSASQITGLPNVVAITNAQIDSLKSL